jgi:hypothetical protein
MDRRFALIPTLVAGALAALASSAMAADAGPPNPDLIPFIYTGLAPTSPSGPVDPTYTVKALDNLGDNFFARLVNYYKLEWGHDGAPVDPNALPSRRPPPWPAQPETQPPYPFTEYSYGGTTSLGVNRPNSVDSPLMVALAPTAFGKWMGDNNIQMYGWLNGGFNVSNEKVEGGNWPAAYSYRPNKLSLDQLVLYIERTPDTVQKDHFDWGFRVSGIYGQDYRYTTSFGYTSNALYGHNAINGFDYPMMWLEGYIPWVAEGMLIRVGRYISIPDIEAQLAPNNYMFSHSMTYGYDNYTNTGIMTSTALTRNFFVQAGVSIGTDTAVQHWGQKVTNTAQTISYTSASGVDYVNVANPYGASPQIWKDPGAVPSFAGCLRYQSDSAYDNIYLCMDGINAGQWGYNNLQWYGGTYYHKFNEDWHISIESYVTHQHRVLNISNVGQAGEANPAALAIYANGGSFASPNHFLYNGPFGANCKNPALLWCTTTEQTALAYLNYRWSSLDNLSWRAEYVNDINGQRTGTATNYMGLAFGWQHWFSPQVEVRPEIAYYRSFEAPAFNGNANFGIAPTSNNAVIGSADIIWHF